MENVTNNSGRKKVHLTHVEWATHNFADENLIGEGGFGKVYRGFLVGPGIEIAARKLHYDYGQGDMEFRHEISMLAAVDNRLKHENIVSYIGFCNDNNGKKIIVNKFEANGSLDKHLKDSTLTWMQRLQICVGVARALNHIHYHDNFDSSVIHGNIKSSKILLDDNWNPKLSGFEHSKTNTRARRHRLVLADIVGTQGYIDPTYEKTGFITHKSDIYSFGVVLFEVLCGRRALTILDDECPPDQFFDPNYQQEEKQMRPSSTEKLASSAANSCEPNSKQEEMQMEPSSPKTVLRFQGFNYRSRDQPSSFVGSRPSSFYCRSPACSSVYSNVDSNAGAKAVSLEKPPSIQLIDHLIDQRQLYSFTSSENSYTDVQPFKEQRFKLQPLFTMKRLDHYVHSPKEVLLAQLATSHYEAENLKDLIDPALWEQIDQQSFQVFTKTAYDCLREERAKRPNIDHILKELEIALQHQKRHHSPEEPVVAGAVEGRSSNRLKGENLERLRIPLTHIELATENFTKGYLGAGGFGAVYRAELDLPIEDKSKGAFRKEMRTVAIKCISKTKQGGKDGFTAEVELLARCRHENIVSLLGFCDEGPDLILVYEHASNGSLDDYLANSNSLTWVQRLKICIDIARGLNYLHTIKVEDQQCIIHRDIKSGNILLDKNLVAKIADFGLSRFFPVNQQAQTHISRNIAGTDVYICPVYQNKGKLKNAVDIYSFGVVLFEILSGKLAYDQVYDPYGIAHVARQCFKEGTLNENMIDPKIMEEVDELTSIICRGPNQDSLETFIAIAHRCVAETQKERPTAEKIIEELQKALLYQEKNKHKLQMSFEEVRLATQNFSLENRIGRGGFGDVYKGELKRANRSFDIAAKRWVKSQLQGANEFLTELEVLFEYKHDNIIALLGYCNEKNEKIIVYEYASNGSLDNHLEDPSLTWMKRLQICIDVVEGLVFLHGGFSSEEIVIHRDLKCANILLDDFWKAKISDFGLSLITPLNQENIKFVAGTIGYVDPEYQKWGYLTKESDIYSLGVILFEMLYGKLVAPSEKGYNKKDVISLLKKIDKKENLDSIVFKGIKEQIAPKSLSIFQNIVGECLYEKRIQRPKAADVLKHLHKALEVQEAYELLQHKSPEEYQEMIKMSMSKEKFLSEKKKALYDKFSPGILFPKEEVWFSLGANGKTNEMISASKFSYQNRPLHKWRFIPESRFQKVAKMLDISNLKIQVQIKTRFLSPHVIYGVHLVFKFCDVNFLPSKPMYVSLKYKIENETLHAYFATLRKDKWMMVELYRFLNHKEDNHFEVLLESFSRYYCRSDAVYVEGIEFRAMDKAKTEENEQPKIDQGVLKSNSNRENMRQLLTDNEDIIKRLNLTHRTEEEIASLLFNWNLINEGDKDQKLFSLSQENRKRCHMLQATEVLYDSSDVKCFTLEPSAHSRFQLVGELLSQQVFRVKCKIESQLLSSNTKYVCFLVFKLSEKCHGLQCPVKVRNLLNIEKKEMKTIYFRSPSPINSHDGIWVPKERQDGWMEVRLWEFITNYELNDDHVPMDLKLISYEGTMRGLIIDGLEFRPM